MSFELLTRPEFYVSLLTLTAMEIVLGIDNVVFISILVGKLPRKQQPLARRLGLSLALGLRLALLFTISWVMGLTAPFFSVLGKSFSGRDLILLGGGLFLIAKATHEIHAEVEAGDEEGDAPVASSFLWVVAQLIVIDLVFSLDSIITAIGMAQDIEIMIAAVVIAIIVMYAASGPVSTFIADNPTTKMLALAFLMLIGMALIADGFEVHIPRGYIYSAMAFAALVELFNVLALRKRRRRASMRKRVKR